MAGKIPLTDASDSTNSTDLAALLCNITVSTSPRVVPFNQKEDGAPPLDTGYIILIIGACVAVALLALVALAKRRLVIASALTRRAGPPKGMCGGDGGRCVCGGGVQINP